MGEELGTGEILLGQMPRTKDPVDELMDGHPLLRTPRIGPDATNWPLSSEIPPFPVEVPYRARPDLEKLGNAPLLHEDRQWDAWIQEKEKHHRAGELLLLDHNVNSGELHAMTAAIRMFFQTHAPHGPIDASGAFPWRGGVRPLDPEAFLATLSLSIQEDFALMQMSRSGELQASALSVCFPSGWDPREKIGRSMQALHEPVADNAHLQRAMPAMSTAICTKGPFIRYVWTLTGDGARARRPGVDSTALLSRAEQLWFRCERQTTIPLLGKAALFLIRVLMAPFDQVITSPDRLDRLLAALNSMSPEMLAYKNLRHAHALVMTHQATGG